MAVKIPKNIKVGDTIRCYGILEAVQTRIALKEKGILTMQYRQLNKNVYGLQVLSVPEEYSNAGV